MSTVTETRHRAEPGRIIENPSTGLSFGRIMNSELIKFRSLRSSWITLLAAVLTLFGIGLLLGWTSGKNFATLAPEDALPSGVLQGYFLGQLLIGVLGVLFVSGEYSTGMIRSTLAAVPRRLPVLWSKAAVIGPIALVLTSIGALAAFLLGTPGLDGEKIALSLGDDGVLRSLAGAGVYLGLVAMFGVALGVLIRSSAGAIAALVGILLILPGLASLLPDSLYDSINPYFPSNAGQAAYALHQSSDSLSPGAGLAVFAGWVALTLAGAAYRLVKTDA
jgi:ABC-type transport system involved in multi-copper enzyme maturation permease subunit